METCSRCRGIRVHDPVETPFTIAWNTQLRVRQQFKICAANLDLTMTELLLRVLSDSVFSPATTCSSPTDESQKQEMRK